MSKATLLRSVQAAFALPTPTMSNSGSPREQQRHHRELRESHAKTRCRADELAALMGAVPTITFIAHDTEGRHMSSSRATRELLRLAPGANVSKSAPEDQKPLTFKALKDGRELRPEELPLQLTASTWP